MQAGHARKGEEKEEWLHQSCSLSWGGDSVCGASKVYQTKASYNKHRELVYQAVLIVRGASCLL